jgi:hypothetical protein
MEHRGGLGVVGQWKLVDPRYHHQQQLQVEPDAAAPSRVDRQCKRLRAGRDQGVDWVGLASLR